MKPVTAIGLAMAFGLFGLTFRGARARFWERMTRVRMEFFEEPGPCGTGVRVAGLAYPDLLIEVEAIAVLPEFRIR